MQLIGHRGASGSAPENTLNSIKHAIELGVDFVEIDIHLSKDEIPVVIHDPTLDRTTNAQIGKGVHELTLKEIQSFDAGNWFGEQFKGERIPSLDEVLSLDFKTTGLMIEIKKDFVQPSKIAPILMKTLSQYKKLPQLKIGSFSAEIVTEIHKENPTLAMGIIENDQAFEVFRKMRVHCLAVWYPLLNPMLIKNCHEEGMRVWAFTVDNPAIAKFLLSIHTDGIITNHPQIMFSLK